MSYYHSRKNRREVRREIWKQQGCRCCWCDQKILFEESTLEHLRARATGGGNERLNLAVACAKCNHERGVRLHAALNEPEPEQEQESPVKRFICVGKKSDKPRGRKRVVDRFPPARYHRLQIAERDLTDGT